MPLQIFPKMPPYPLGCRSCWIAQCNTLWRQDEQGEKMATGFIWSCREKDNSVIQDFNLCPIIDLPYIERDELFQKYNYTQGEN